MHKLENVSSNPGKVHFELSINILRYIRGNNNWGFKYYAYMNYAPVSDLLIKDSINTENHLMDFSGSILKYCLDTGRNIGAYITFYQGGPIDHGTNVPGTVAQSSAES